MEREALRHTDALNSFWDDLALGRAPIGPHAIDGETVDLVARLQALGDPPARDSARERVWRDLQQHRRWKEPDVPTLSLSSNGAGGPALGPSPFTWAPSPGAPPARRPLNAPWAAPLATALLVLLVLLGSFFASGRIRPHRQADAPAYIPSISGTPATPEVPEAPLAELVWEVSGSLDKSFSYPTGAAIDPQGDLWVTDGGNDRIVSLAPGGKVLAPEGVVLETWGASGSGEGEFEFTCAGLELAGIAFDAAGNSYVADSGNHRIQKFAPDRTFLASWGSEGTADGQFLCPLSLVIDEQGRIYVGDHMGGKIAVFDADGQLLATWTEEVDLPEQLALDGEGNLWVADATRGVQKFSPDGELLTEWDTRGVGEGATNQPMGLAIDAQGRVFVSGQGARVQVFSSDGKFLGGWGSRGRDPGQFTEPAHLVLDGMGNLYVVDLFGFRVQKYRLLPPLAPPKTSAVSGTPASAESVVSETLFDTAVDNVPTAWGYVALLRWALQPSNQPLVFPPTNGAQVFVVESGELVMTVAGAEHRLVAGDTYVLDDPEQEIAFRLSGPEVASLLRGVVVTSLPLASADRFAASSEFLLEHSTSTLPGGSGRLVAERLALPPESALPPKAANLLIWIAVAEGTLGLTLEGDTLPTGWTSGEEKTITRDSLWPQVPAGTRMALRNAGDEPLVLYRMTLTPDAAEATPVGTPVP